jgi:hypothetical protein
MNQREGDDMTDPTREHEAHEEHDDAASRQAAVDEIVARGPGGAFAVAGVATAIVVLIYLAFYAFIYLPRGAVQ